MGKWLIFEIGKGDFQQGFSVVVRMGSDGVAGRTRIEGYLPPASDVQIALEHWRQACDGWTQLPPFMGEQFGTRSSIKAKPVQRLNVSLREAANDLADSVSNWLDSKDRDWSKIRDALQQKLGQTNDEIRIIVQTENIWLRRLPWQAWNLLTNHYPQAEIVVSPTEQDSPIVTLSNQKSSKVKILAILGNTQGQGQEINIEADRQELERLTGAVVEFLVQPQPNELRDRLWQENWQILFFAGHSGSFDDGLGGWIELNQQDSITIDDLKESVRTAIGRGLQLVIFNSCDGLGLAKQLEDLHLAQMIVMRERVPDRVAQDFLQHLFRAFANDKANKSLHAAVREARAKLKDSLESKYPGASWLPVICQQHPDAKPLSWKQLRDRTWNKSSTNQRRATAFDWQDLINTQPPKVRALFLAGAAVLIVVGAAYAFEHKSIVEQQTVRKVVEKATQGDYQASFPRLSQRQSPSSDNQQAQQLPLNGSVVTGKLGRGDAVFPNHTYYKLYRFEARALQQIIIEMNSQSIDPALILINKDGKVIARNDDISPSNFNSRIVTTLPNDGTYIALAISSEPGESGAYSLRAKVLGSGSMNLSASSP